MCVCISVGSSLSKKTFYLHSGAIALAEVLAENKHISHLDLRENDVRVAGLMGLQLAHRMNHALLHMDTPKSYKVDQVRGGGGGSYMYMYCSWVGIWKRELMFCR